MVTVFPWTSVLLTTFPLMCSLSIRVIITSRAEVGPPLVAVHCMCIWAFDEDELMTSFLHSPFMFSGIPKPRLSDSLVVQDLEVVVCGAAGLARFFMAASSWARCAGGILSSVSFGI